MSSFAAATSPTPNPASTASSVRFRTPSSTKNSVVEITPETSVTSVISRRRFAVPECMIATSSTHSVGLRRWVWLTARGLGALSLLAVGAVHLQQYEDLYS